MEITYFGYSCVEIKQKGVTFLLDPYEPTGKIAHPRAKAHVVTISRPAAVEEARIAVPSATEDDVVTLSTPGGFEAKGVLIEGFASFADNQDGHEYGPNVIFTYQWSGMNIVHLGRLGHELSSDVLEELGTVDILFVTIGDRTSAEVANKVVDQIEPRAIIVLGIDDGEVEKFVKETGLTAETPEVIKLEERDLPSDGQKLFVPKAQ